LLARCERAGGPNHDVIERTLKLLFATQDLLDEVEAHACRDDALPRFAPAGAIALPEPPPLT
jgi:hypothetical protein